MVSNKCLDQLKEKLLHAVDMEDIKKYTNEISSLVKCLDQDNNRISNLKILTIRERKRIAQLKRKLLLVQEGSREYRLLKDSIYRIYKDARVRERGFQ